MVVVLLYFFVFRRIDSVAQCLSLSEVLDKSCGNDVEDELAIELDDNPGTTTGTKFSVLHRIIVPLWLLTTGRFFRDLRIAARPMTGQRFAPSRRDPGRERILVLPRLLAFLHWL